MAWLERRVQDMTSVLTETERETIRRGKTHQERYAGLPRDGALAAETRILWATSVPMFLLRFRVTSMKFMKIGKARKMNRLLQPLRCNLGYVCP